ncbi:MAG: ATP-binding protein [Candidatus Algichlamydia australiensis]|nr:ATP-binding protein [Chlamydiales bacterium]
MFIGREKELKLLRGRESRRSASFVVIRGRRRIGKSRLITEFSKDFSKKYLFTALPPNKKTTAKKQRSEFVRQMKEQGLPSVAGDDWGDIFWVLGKACDKGPVLLVLDEISWIGAKDPEFLGKLKIAWDQHFEINPRLVLVVASSISSWIDKNILKNTGFFGRIDLILSLKELSIKDCIKFWGKREKSVSAFEKLKVLGVTGGVPKYLNQIDPKKTAEQNLKELCFMDSGLLFNEFDRIFHDLFSKKKLFI